MRPEGTSDREQPGSAIGAVGLLVVLLLYVAGLHHLSGAGPSVPGWLRLLATSTWLGATSACAFALRPPAFHLTKGGRSAWVFAFPGGLLLLIAVLCSRFGPLGESAQSLPKVLLLVLLVPVAEELFFRGLLLDDLRRRIGPIGAALLVSLLFGVLHIARGTVVAMGLFSVLLAAVTLLSRSLLWAALLHIGWNGLALARTLPDGPERTFLAGLLVLVGGAMLARGLWTGHGEALAGARAAAQPRDAAATRHPPQRPERTPPRRSP